MALPQPPTSPHLYPQALQLKLYQAFIFSIPILFSIILFLLFYLFYLKRRASSLSSTPQLLPTGSNQATSNISSACQVVLKEKLRAKLQVVLFDEALRAKDSQCCVCLGEFEIKEELLQIPSCKHVFHNECIHHWLHSNLTCPLCRCFVIPITKLGNLPLSGVPQPLHQVNGTSNQHPQNLSSEQQQGEIGASVTEQHVIPIEGSSGPRTGTMGWTTISSSCDMSRSPAENGRGSLNRESVVLRIQADGT